jgi:hypothetical protein
LQVIYGKRRCEYAKPVPTCPDPPAPKPTFADRAQSLQFYEYAYKNIAKAPGTSA